MSTWSEGAGSAVTDDQQRRAAEQLRAAHVAYQPVIEGTWAVDAEGRTVSTSAPVAELLGYTEDELRGTRVDELTDADGRALLRAASARRRRGCRDAYEMRWRHRDGSEVWTLLAAMPLEDCEGGYGGSFALITDITERRRTEARLQRHARQQEAVARIGRLALDGMEPSALMDVAVRVVAGVLGAEYATVALPRPDGALEEAAAHGERLGVRSTVAAQVTARAGHGVLTAHRTRDWRAERDETAFVEAIANVLASALDRARADRELRRSALHDPLTGLPNRTLVLDRLGHALERGARGGPPLALLLINLDRFRLVNAALGDQAGDAVLRDVAERLRGAVRPSDTVGRLGGDEFVVVCEGLPDDAAGAALAGRLVEAFREPFAVGGEDHRLTLSVGVAYGSGTPLADAVLRDAVAATDRAKARGRDRFEVFDAALGTSTAARVALERDLRRAVERGEIVAAFQPIVALSDGAITGVEALARWRHPARGMVSPAEFIPVAEDTGLIGGIGGAVLREACERVARWREDGHRLTCHVNLSPHQVADPCLAATVAEVLETSGLPVEALVLELTESSVMEGGQQALDRLQELRHLGVRLVLDDFGTGYSSLSRLRRFPLDGIKVDRSFVADMGGDAREDVLIVAGIVELARTLGLTVVAEGVETREQLALLRRIGCRYAQGFLLARPLDAPAFAALLAGPGLDVAAAAPRLIEDARS